MTRRFNHVPKTFRERTFREKLFFWKSFLHFVETEDPQAEYEEILVHGKTPFIVYFKAMPPPEISKGIHYWEHNEP